MNQLLSRLVGELRGTIKELLNRKRKLGDNKCNANFLTQREICRPVFRFEYKFRLRFVWSLSQRGFCKNKDEVVFYSSPKIVHNAPPPFLSNKKIPPTPLNSEIRFFPLKPGPLDPHIRPLTSWRYTQYLYELNHSHCSRAKVITDLIAFFLLPVVLHFRV